MSNQERGAGISSPLAYKRKQPPSLVSTSSRDTLRANESNKRQRQLSFPEVVIDPEQVSPWSSEWRHIGSPAVSPSPSVYTISDDEDYEDDVITLLPTKKSIAEYASSLSTSSPIRGDESRPSAPRNPHRSAMEKMTSLMEDIFEAETDIQGGEGNSATLSSHAKVYFTLQDGVAMLRSEMVDRIVRLTIACPTGHGIVSHGVSDVPLRWSEMDSQEVSRLIKAMHRGLDSATGLDPFPLLQKESKRSSPAKKTNHRRLSASPTKGINADQVDEEALLSGSTIEEMKIKLSRIAYSTLIADGCLAILSKEGTSKFLLCEEMILPCLQLIKTALDHVVVPFAEVCSGVNSCCNPLLNELALALGSLSIPQQASSTSPKHGQRSHVSACGEHLTAIFRSLMSSLPRLELLLKKTDLVLSETMSFVLADSLLPPFFVLDPASPTSTAGQQAIKLAALNVLCDSATPMKGLRLSAINVLRLTYERSEEYKEYIITSILDNMQSLQDIRKQARRQFGLTNGKAICASTALLLQIIQASAKPIAKAKKMERMEWEEEDQAEAREEQTATESDVYKLDVLREGQDMARRAAEAVAQCLMHRVKSAGAAKASKTASTLDSGFSIVMESLVSDLLDTLSCPEWPASSLLLSQLCIQFCSYLDDDKGSHEVRSMALDQLGLMAMRWVESKRRCEAMTEKVLPDVDVIRKAMDVKGLEQLNLAYWHVIDSLKQKTDDDGSMESAARFLEAQWGREMALFLYRCVDMVTVLSEGENQEEEEAMTVFIRQVDTMIGQTVTRADSNGVRDDTVVDSNDDITLSVSDTYQRLMHTFAFGSHFNVIEGQLISASNGPNATNRNKALRGLSYISDVDHHFLLKDDVRAAVQRCLYDESVHVRDTAVALLGKFALSHPAHLPSLLINFKEKMEDTGLLVRKRTLRLFKDIYDASSENKIRVEAAMEIIQSVFDEEETLRDLAVETTAQIWFGLSSSATSGKSPSKPQQGRRASKNDEQEREGPEGDEVDTFQLQNRLCNIVQVAERLRIKPSPVQEVLRQIVKKRDGEELQEQMSQLVHLTIDNIVESQQKTQELVAAEELVKQVEVIALLVQTNPLTLSIRKAKLLLPYLRGGSKDAEVRLLGRLLAIFNSCLPLMAGTASSFAKQLQSTLTPLISRPSNHIAVIEELIKCYCTVIRSQTHDVGILIKTMQMCHRQVKKVQVNVPTQEMELRNAKVLIITTSLLAENADYDAIRTEYPTFASDVDQITPNSVSEEVTIILTSLLEEESIRTYVLQSLRFVCRAFPKLMVGDVLGDQMESILQNGTIQDQFAVLRIVADIMEVESVKLDPDQISKGRGNKVDKDKKVSREELAGESESQGNPATFEIVSRFGDLIQALAVCAPLQKQVLEIIEVIVMRGICHPLQYLSTIISLQTVTSDKWISSKAQSLHRHLINKSNSSINFRQMLHARDAWQFQTKREGIEVRGCDEDEGALFETWYNTIREQRKTRLDFLKALIKAFDVDISTGECWEDDVHYARFITDNLATLNYKTVEEVVLVASELQNVLTMAGEQVQISVQEEIPVDGEEEGEEDDDDMDEEESERAIVIGRMSTIMTMALRLLSHLREQYNLSDGKIARGLDKKASNAVAVRKVNHVTLLILADLPGALNRKESVALAKREMNTFDNMLNSEGIGAEADDYDLE